MCQTIRRIGNADRLVGLVISWGAFRYLTQGVTEQELGIDQLKDVAHRVIGANLFRGI